MGSHEYYPELKNRVLKEEILDEFSPYFFVFPRRKKKNQNFQSLLKNKDLFEFEKKNKLYL